MFALAFDFVEYYLLAYSAQCVFGQGDDYCAQNAGCVCVHLSSDVYGCNEVYNNRNHISIINHNNWWCLYKKKMFAFKYANPI